MQTLIFEQFVELKALHGDSPPIPCLTLQDPDTLQDYAEYTGPSHGVPSAADRAAMSKLIERKLEAIFSRVAPGNIPNTDIAPDRAKALKAATAVTGFGSFCHEASVDIPLLEYCADTCSYWKVLLEYYTADVPHPQRLMAWIGAAESNPKITKEDASPVAMGLLLAANALALKRYRKLSRG